MPRKFGSTSFHQPTAQRKMLCMFDPGMVRGFPVEQRATAVEAGAAVAGPRVKEPGLGQKHRRHVHPSRIRPPASGCETLQTCVLQRKLGTVRTLQRDENGYVVAQPLDEGTAGRRPAVYRYRVPVVPVVDFALAGKTSGAVVGAKVVEPISGPQPTRVRARTDARCKRVETRTFRVVHRVRDVVVVVCLRQRPSSCLL